MPVRVVKCTGHKNHKCGKTVRATGSKQKRCPPCEKVYRREYHRMYGRTYVLTPKSREAMHSRMREYNRIPKRRDAVREYNRTHREARRKYALRYSRIPKNREARRRYMRALAGRHSRTLSRSRKLKQRRIVGRPISSEQHRKKIYYLDGRPRPCTYCLHEVGKGGSGLDRVDSNVGYTDLNTVVCCGGCNSWKNSYHTFEETMKHFKPMRDAKATQ